MILVYILGIIALFIIAFLVGCHWEKENQKLIDTQFIQYAKHQARKDQSFITEHAQFLRKQYEVDDYKDKHQKKLHEFLIS